MPLTAGLGGLSARGPLGDEVAQFLLQIRKLGPRAEKDLVLDPLVGQDSQNWGSLVFLLGLQAEAVGQYPSPFGFICRRPPGEGQYYRVTREVGGGGGHEQGSSQVQTVSLTLWLLIYLNRI